MIERDSLTIAWTNGLPMLGLELAGECPGVVASYVDAFVQVGIEVRCSMVTLDWGVPTVVAMARSRIGGIRRPWCRPPLTSTQPTPAGER